MRKNRKALLFSVFILLAYVSVDAQIGMGFVLNRQQKNRILELLNQQNVGIVFQSSYHSENSSIPFSYNIALLDTNYEERLNITLDSLKKIKSYSVTKHVLQSRIQASFDASNNIEYYDLNYFKYNDDLVEAIHLSKESKIYSKVTYYFDDQGSIDSMETFGPDGRLTFKTKYELNRLGFPVKGIMKGMDGSLFNEIEINYDRNNFAVEVNSILHSVNKRFTSSFSYDPNGLISEKRELGNMKLNVIRKYEYITKDSVQTFLRKNNLDTTILKNDFEFNFSNNYFLEHQPLFPGGYGKLMEYINRNKKYPKNLPDKTAGSVIVAFKVNKDGSLSDVKIQKGFMNEYDELAIELVKNMPKWIPAKRSDGTIYEGSTAVKIEY